MIHHVQGNLLESRAEALVNAVNTVGVMGKGIALALKQRFELNYRLYAAACQAGQVVVGRMFVTETGLAAGPRWIVNFPTKQHWRQPSRLAWVSSGLADLRRFIQQQGLRSIAIPALGAGMGGLPWADVRAAVETALGDLPDVHIELYAPQGDAGAR